MNELAEEFQSRLLRSPNYATYLQAVRFRLGPLELVTDYEDGSWCLHTNKLLRRITRENLSDWAEVIGWIAAQRNALAVEFFVALARRLRRPQPDEKFSFDRIDDTILCFWDTMDWWFGTGEPTLRYGLKFWSPAAAASFVEWWTGTPVTEDMFTQRRKRLGLTGGKRKLITTARRQPENQDTNSALTSSRRCKKASRICKAVMPQTAKLENLAIRAPIAQFVAALGDERLLNREQAAAFLAVSPRTSDYFCAMARGCQRTNRTVRGQAKTGRVEMPASPQKLPHFKIGHKVFFQLGDLRAFRDQRKIAA